MQIKSFLHTNFGDEPLNRYLYEKITGQTAKFISLDTKLYKYYYLLSGSILSKATDKAIVWGSGFITQNACVPKIHKIYAVRGKLSWNQLKHNKIDAPYIFGDPGLILPKFFNPTITKKYLLGIIPHYTEQSSLFLNQYLNTKNIKIINICQDVETVITEILQCENIASSSLHGLIVSDIYKVPNVWLGIGDKIQGVGYKYFDYYSITDRNPIIKYNLTQRTNYQDIIKHCKISNFIIDLEKFWEVCPLRRENVK